MLLSLSVDSCSAMILVVLSLFILTANCQWLKKVELNQLEEISISTTSYPFDSTLKEWHFYAPSGNHVMATCTSINFPRALNCQDGGMVVWDGEKTKRYCGSSKHLVIKSVNNELKLRVSSVLNAAGNIKCFIKPTEEEDNVSQESEQKLSISKNICECGWTNTRKRIVGGTETQANEFPFMVSLMVARGRGRFCGGSIITEYHILTAAHCIDEMKNSKLYVSVGEHDAGKSYSTNATEYILVAKQYPHEQYNTKTVKNDIAILLLTKKIKFNSQVGPVCLPWSKLSLINQQIKAIGWGKTNTEETIRGLRQVNLRVIDINTCSAKYYYTIDTNRATQICTYARNKDTCQGDSGGPLIYLDQKTNKYTQVALVSFGKGCATSYPGVNTDVYAYMTWIENTVKKTGHSMCKKS